MSDTCSIPNCTSINTRTVAGMCVKHYAQVRKYGAPTRSFYDPNQIDIVGEIALVSIYNRKSEKIGISIIDSECAALVGQYKWGLVDGYLRCAALGVMLHNFVMGNNDKRTKYDHINRDRLDNRKQNLRLCTEKENAFNRGMRSDNKTGAKGVFWHKAVGKYNAVIVADGVRENLGWFTEVVPAAVAYNEAAKRIHGEFAVLNDISALRRKYE